MKLLLANPRGFCAGVVRAIETVEKAISIWGAPIYVKHEIVHNRHVVNDLKKKGAIFIEDLEDVPEGSRLIYSAHGVSPIIREQAKRRNLKEIDATCVLVTKLHSAAKLFAKRGYQIIIIGHKKHVEVIGTAQEVPEKTTVIEKVSDIDLLSFDKDEKLIYLAQSTLSVDDIKIIVAALKKKYPQIETLPSSSICYATINRQNALKQIAKEADVIFVIGDPKSSNSNRLKEISQTRDLPSYLINSEEEITSDMLLNKKVVGMTAGASTPEDIVQRCIKRCRELGVKEVEDVIYTKEEVVFQLPKELLDTSC
jgi:4-hydroxy-3-methylbut-2-enyl diphosphate reductase